MPEIKADPDRVSIEKETMINFYNREEMSSVFSAQRAVISALFGNEYFELEWWSDGDGRYYDEPGDDDVVCAVSGEIPVGCLTVKGKPRSENTPSGVVNKTKDIPDGAFD